MEETTQEPEKAMEEVPQAADRPKKTRKHHPILAFVASVREFGNQVAKIKVKWLVAGMLVFLFSVVLTQVQFNDVNSREREKLEEESQDADYVLELTAYNQAVVAYDACLEGVTRSDGNRAWKTWLLDKLGSTFAESPEAQDIVTEGRQKLDEYLPPRTIQECEDRKPGPAPTPPEH